MEWYYAKGEERVGPVSSSALSKLVRDEGLDPATLVWRKDMPDWMPFSQCELARLPEIPKLEAQPNSNPDPNNPYATPASMAKLDLEDLPPGDPEELKLREPKFDLGSCLSRSWALMKNDFWPIVGVSAMIYLIYTAASSILSGLAYLIYIPLYAGFDLYCLQKIRKQYAGVEVSFAGFTKPFLPLFLIGLVTCAVGLAIVPGVISYLFMDDGMGLMRMFANPEMFESDAFNEDPFQVLATPSVLTVVLSLLGLAAYTYFYTVWTFAKTLCIDKKLGMKDSFGVSFKVCNKGWIGLFGFKFVIGLVAMLGMFGLCIGIFVTLPLYYLALMYAYEDTFGDAPTADPLENP